MEASEPKTPSEGAREGEDRGSAAAEPAVGASSELETPQAASLARSAPELLGSASSAPSLSVSEKNRGKRKWGIQSGTRMALAFAGGAAALLGAVLAAPMAFKESATARNAGGEVVNAVSLAAAIAASETVVGSSPADAASDGPHSTLAAPSHAAVWRVAQLSEDSGVRLIEETVGHRPLLAVLAAVRLSPNEAQRLVRALSIARSSDRLDPKDTVKIATEKATGRVVAFEYASSPSEVWQAREEPQPDGTMKLEAQRLELQTSRVRIGKAIVVGADLRASLEDAGLTPVDEVVSMLDDALERHAELSDIRAGARLRIVGTQEQVDGAFVRWVSLDAVEYVPASPNASPVRVYAFGEGGDGDDAKRRQNWYDAKGRQPLRGGFRAPVPLARIASRFNPHRMHPVLHVVVPHNGIDLAAPVGTPVYATAAGIVTSVGSAGPCGNKVEISHAGGITSVYCHLSRYAAGLHAGQHVEQRQLIAYVGQTGRVTGPHLHFGIKRNGVFIDPMSLRLDGVHVIPHSLRDEFDRRRAELDTELDGIPLPPAVAGSGSVEPGDRETFDEEP